MMVKEKKIDSHKEFQERISDEPESSTCVDVIESTRAKRRRLLDSPNGVGPCDVATASSYMSIDVPLINVPVTFPPAIVYPQVIKSNQISQLELDSDLFVIPVIYAESNSTMQVETSTYVDVAESIRAKRLRLLGSSNGIDPYKIATTSSYSSIDGTLINVPITFPPTTVHPQGTRPNQVSHFELGSGVVPLISGALNSTVQIDFHPKASARATRRRQAHPVETNTLATVPVEASTLPSVPSCSFCMAKRFFRETPTFCCSTGEVNIKSYDAPDDLWKLFTGITELSKEFKTYVRTYNNTFAFTSFGVKYDKDLCRRNRGIYTFRAQGQIYHCMNTLLPLDKPPSYLQLYFYDTEHELDNRLRISDRMSTPILKFIMNILERNPYCQFFRSLVDVHNLEECRIVIKNVTSLDQRIYNAPSSSQVAAIWVEGDAGSASDRDVIVFSKPGSAVRICYYYGCYDPLQYPLLFPLGESGWHQGIKKTSSGDAILLSTGPLPQISSFESVEQLMDTEQTVMQHDNDVRGVVSCREYYSFKLQMRPNQKSILLHSGRLLQQYAVDMYIKLESSRLDYLGNQQKKIRADLYSGIVDSIAVGERRGFKIGSRVVLPASFIGGPRDMRRRYLDAMTLVRKFGKPDLFITMTCNPNWLEIKRELLPGEEAQNRPDLLTRVFRAKFEELKHDVVKNKIFGPVAAYVYVIEFQKRGLPHMHMLLILKNGHKIRSPDQFNSYVSAEFPIESDNPHLFRAVSKHMMHGPCGDLNPHNICMKNGTCKNHYPKDFCTATSQTEDSYPLYRRRNNKQKIRVRGKDLDNRWVIPYNPYLLAKFDCHLNVEVCSTVKAVKYLYKYIYKGHDRVAFKVITDPQTGAVDEISSFRDGRWVSPPEAMWRIYGFLLNEIYPAVVTLQLHLHHDHSVTYADSSDLQNVVDSPMCKRTTLTDYFTMNSVNADARKLLYCDFPEQFVWHQSNKSWKPRKKGIAIGRVVSVSPGEGERFYLKLLLSHIKGATSFDDLKLFQGCMCNSFRESAVAHGLVEEDHCFRNALTEACEYQMPQSLRRLFSTMLGYCNPVNARTLWEEFAAPLSEDFRRLDGVTQRSACKMALRDICFHLESMGKDINEYMLVDNRIVVDESERGYKEINDELNIDFPLSDLQNVDLLNNEQKQAYNVILECVSSGQPGSFFVDGPGGTGKSFLYCVLLATVRNKGDIALATASSGVAASLLPGGRTAHSRFKIPLAIEPFMTCSVTKQSGLGKLLRAAKLIIWDEAPMIRRQSIEAFERMLCDVCESALPFGGKVVVFGGDFRQILPVVPKGSMNQTVCSSLVKSPLWSLLTKIRLTENLRAKSNPLFSKFLLQVGEGTVETLEDDLIELPSIMTLPYDGITSVDVLINLTYPDLQKYSDSTVCGINRVILSTKNEFVDELNETIISRFPGDFHEYKSFDIALESSHQGLQEDFFNSMTPSGFPPHILKLKKNCPVILLRNIDPSKGLCNGTRLICKTFGRNVIGAVIASGNYQGKHVFLPRIPLTPPSSEISAFPFKRTQFPIRLCFCMTINKSQGQTLDFVGIYLPQPVFSHGQLYVALSRAREASSIAILVVPAGEQPLSPITTKNVVYKEVLTLAAVD